MRPPGTSVEWTPQETAHSDLTRASSLHLTGAIFLLAFIVRLIPLGFYVTPDEPIWVLRSVQALDAVRAGDWGAIPQTGHPGIVTMALGAVGTWITARLAPVTASEHLSWIRSILWLAPENAAAFPHLAFFLPAGRVSVALVVSLGLALAHRVARRRFGLRAARLMALFLALDPFFSGYAGLLHTDALQATFALLAVLLALPAVSSFYAHDRNQRGQWLSWIGSGLFLALAGLTKTLGLLVAPGIALVVLLWGQGTIRRRALRVAVIAVTAVVCLFALYPPCWTDPVGAIRSLLGAVTYHEGIGLRPVFFLGKSQVDPGPAFYPVVLLFRLTPPVFIGLLIGIRKARWEGACFRRCLWVLTPAVIYLALITVASKKFDRYALTAVPLLTVAAAFGWRRIRWGRWVIYLGLALPWALTALIPLQYASPLLGGPWAAQYLVPLGWSEGSGFAAHHLNQLLPSSETARVMSPNVPGTASVFKGAVWSWDAAQQGCVDAVLGVEEFDTGLFAQSDALSISGLSQTTIATRILSSFPEERLVAPGPLPGIDPASTAPATSAAQLAAWLDAYLQDTRSFVWIHAPACYGLTESQLHALLGQARETGALTCTLIDPVLGFSAERCDLMSSLTVNAGFLARFGGQVDLVAAAPETLARAPNPVAVQLRWHPQVSLPNLELYLALITDGEGGQIVWAEGGRQLVDGAGRPSSVWQPGSVVDSEEYIPLSLDLPPGTYDLIMQVSEPGGWMGLTHSDDSFGGVQMALGAVRVEAPPYPASALDLPAISNPEWPGVQLVGARISDEIVWAGDSLHFSLGVARTVGPVPSSLAWHLICDGDRQGGGALSWPVESPSVWPGGHRYVLRYAPRLDARTPSGQCQVWLTAASEHPEPEGDNGAAALLADGSAVLLGEIQVAQRDRVFDLPHVPDIPIALTAGSFAQLVGADLSSTSLAPGDSLPVALYWKATGTALKAYTVFVHLVGPDGQVWAQSDSAPDAGRAPTVTWLPGEVIVDIHNLTVKAAAPAGHYRLYVGLYDPQTGTRADLYEGGQRLTEARAQVADLTLTYEQ